MTTVERPAGLSVWEARIFDRLASHLSTEGPLLATYSRLAEGSGSEYVRYLVGLVLEDEARHHRLLKEFLNAVCLSVRPHPTGPAVPSPGRLDDPDELLALTNRLIVFEEQDSRSLRALNREVREVRDHTLWALVVETMRRDTEKHLAILRFIRARALEARSRRRPRSGRRRGGAPPAIRPRA